MLLKNRVSKMYYRQENAMRFSAIPGLFHAEGFVKWNHQERRVEGFIDFFIIKGPPLKEAEMKALRVSKALLGQCYCHRVMLFSLPDYSSQQFIRSSEGTKALNEAFIEAASIACKLNGKKVKPILYRLRCMGVIV